MILCKLNFRTNLANKFDWSFRNGRRFLNHVAIDFYSSSLLAHSFCSFTWALISLSCNFIHAYFRFPSFVHHKTSIVNKTGSSSCISRWIANKCNSQQQKSFTYNFLMLFSSHCKRNMKITLIPKITSQSQCNYELRWFLLASKCKQKFK